MNNPFLRGMLAEVFAADDAQRAEFEEWERKQQKMKEKQAPDLVYKRNDNARVTPHAAIPQPQAATTMSVETSKGWNGWADRKIEFMIKDNNRQLTKAMGEAMGEVVSTIRREWRDEIARAVGELRADLEVKEAAKVIDLPDFRKRGNG